MRKLAFLAVFAGSFLGIGLSFLIVNEFESHLMSVHHVEAVTDLAASIRLLNELDSSASLAFGRLTILFFCGIVAGYITATIAKRLGILACLLASVLPLVANAYLSHLSHPAAWLGWKLVSAAAVIGIPGWFALGGYIRVLQSRWRAWRQ